MTSTFALVVALSLIVNDLTVILQERLLNHRFLAASLVYLISTAILLAKCKIVPTYMFRNCRCLRFLLEIPIAGLLLECSLIFIWRFIQEYVNANADRLLVHLADDRGLEDLVCYFCCGKADCSSIIADLTLKIISFSVLLTVCLVIGFK